MRGMKQESVGSRDRRAWSRESAGAEEGRETGRASRVCGEDRGLEMGHWKERSAERRGLQVRWVTPAGMLLDLDV